MLEQNQLFEYVKSKLFINYLEENKFVLLPRKRKDVCCYQKFWQGRLIQVNVPLSHSLLDFGQAMEESIRTIAEYQMTSPLELCVRFSDLVRVIGQIECTAINKHAAYPEIQVVYLDKTKKIARKTVKIEEKYFGIASLACHDTSTVDIIGVPWTFSPSTTMLAKYIHVI